MASPLISQYLPPDIDPTKVSIAYGRRALPKLNEELQSPDLLTRQKALMALCDLVHDPEHVYVAISIGFLNSLKLLLKDPDSTVRHKTIEVLYIMANHSVGREGFLKHRVILELSQILDDPVLLCRTFMHKAYRSVAQVPQGADAIMASGLIPFLVNKVKDEDEEIQGIILDTLYFCLQWDASQAFQSQVVPILREKLSSPNQEIRSKAAHTLMAICMPRNGKDQVWHCDVIPLLVLLLDDPSIEVKGNAAGALMFAAVTTEGKYAALDAGAIPFLLELLDIDVVKVRLNAIKALTMLAEAPEGRRDLLPEVYRFKVLIHNPVRAVSRAAQIATKVIEWKP
ncbi:radial spoke head 14 homolog [Trichosurus vulpecula]|uniref:radial spoke head 14 homolog n=1 Tax=Trichosurus vulpecula TaxID=9337 RepID=UPI00186AF3E5|nr:radial spoke head 14 homolog [Trichosurus vulpecula]